MRLKLASRQSDLARIQSHWVARVLNAKNPALEIEMVFRESLGDKNLSDPLWRMPEKGVFTEDFVAGLKNGEFDLVVHSWKDLPTAPRPGLIIAATLKREDPRDVILFRPEVLKLKNESLKLFSSSPRREYNLKSFLPSLLPFSTSEVEFLPVRGNVPTRLRKMLGEEVHGLVVAKAALDRLLKNPFSEFDKVKTQLREDLRGLLWMVMPLSLNPPAAAQGALAIEISEHREDLKNLLSEINDQKSFLDVQREREILSSYGGGCHQKIGVHVETLPYGQLTFLKGLSDQGELLSRRDLKVSENTEVIPEGLAWPPLEGEMHFHRLSTVTAEKMMIIRQAEALFVAKHSAWPSEYQGVSSQLVWTAGVESWRHLAKKGVWVSGCQDGLGDDPPRNFSLIEKPFSWLTLTHEGAVTSREQLGTYSLQPVAIDPKILKCEYFFWKSASTFKEVVRQYPVILNRKHFCGPGKTLMQLQALLPLTHQPQVFLDEKQWRETLVRSPQT